MTKQHLDELYTKGLITKKTDFIRIILALLLLVAGIVLFATAKSIGANNDTLQIGAYVVGAFAAVGGIWILCAGCKKTVNCSTGECFAKKVFYIKSADINNIINSFRQLGINNEIKNLGSGAYRVVTLSTKNSLYIAFYQYVPHEYTNASDLISVDGNDVPQVINAVGISCI